MSQTIDNKVVEMQFNNSNFEQNVKTSLSTIDKLKAALNFGGMSKGLSDLDKASKNVSFDQIADSLDMVNKRFSTMGIIGMTVLQNMTNSALNFAKRGIGTVTGAIISGGKRRAFNIENAHFQLQGLLKDEEKVQAIMQDAMDSVDGTAYAYDEAAKAASQFAASGMQAGEEMQSALRAITGVAAMTNSEYESISRIFTQVSGNGRLMGDDLLQLSSRGMNAAATITDYFNKVNDGSVEASESVTKAIKEVSKGTQVTEGDIREMVSKGKISFEIFSAAMDNAFGEHAKKANETFTGALSNVRAALSRIGAEFISPLIVQNGPLVNFFNELRLRINDIKKNIGPLAELFTSTVTELANSATNFLKGLDVAPFFKGINKAAKSLKEMMTSPYATAKDVLGLKFDAKSFSAFRDVVIQTAREHNIAIDEMMEKEGGFLASLSKGWLTGDIFTEALDKIKKGDLKSEAKETTEQLESLHEIAAKVIRGDYGNGQARIDALTEAGYDPKVVQSYVNTLHELTNGTWELSDAIYEQADARTESSESIKKMSDEQLKALGYTEDEIKALKEWAENVEKSGGEANAEIDKLLAKLQRPSGVQLLFGTVQNTIRGLIDLLKPVKEAFVETFTPGAGELLYDFLTAVHGISENFKLSDLAASQLKNTFSGLFEGILLGVEAIGSVAGPVFTKLLLPTISKLGSNFLKIGNAAGNFVKTLRQTLKQSGTFQKVSNWLGKSMSELAVSFGKVIDFGGNFITDIIEKGIVNIPNFVKRFEEFAGKVKNSSVFKTISEFADNALKKVSSFFGGLSESGALNNVSNGFKQIGLRLKEMYKSFRESEIVKSFAEKIKKLRVNVVDLFKSFKISDFTAIAKDVFANIQNGISGIISGRVNPFEVIKGWITDHNPLEALKQWFSSLTEGDKNPLSWLSNVIEKIKEKLEKAKETISTFFSPYINKIKAFFKDLSFEDIYDVTKKGTMLWGLISLVRTLWNLSGLLGRIKRIPSRLSGMLHQLTMNLKAEEGKFMAETFLKIAEGLAILMGAFTAMTYFLGKMDPEVANRGLTYAFLISMIVGALSLAIGMAIKLAHSGGATGATPIETLFMGITNAMQKFAKLAGGGILLAGLGIAVSSIVYALTTLMSLKWDEAKFGVAYLVGIAGGILLFCGILAKINTNGSLSVGAAATIVALALAINIMQKAVKAFAGMDFTSLLKGLGSTIVLLAGLGNAMWLMGQAKLKASTALSILAMALAIKVLQGAVKTFAGMQLIPLAKGIGSVMLLLAVLGKAMGKVGKGTKNKTAALAILAIAAAIKILESSVKNFSQMSIGEIIKGIGSLIVVLISLGLAMKAIGKGTKNISAAVTIIAMAGALKILEGVVQAFAGMDLLGLVKGVGGIGALLFALSMAMATIKASTGSWGELARSLIALGAMVAAIYVLSGVIKTLAELPVENALAATLGLSALLLSMGGAMRIMGSMDLATMGKGILGIVAVVGTIVLIMEILGALAENIEGFSTNIEAAAELIGSSIGHLLGAFEGARDAAYVKEFADTVNGIKFNDDNIEKAENIMTFLSTLAGKKSIQSFDTGFLGLMANHNVTLRELGKGAVWLGQGVSSFVTAFKDVDIPTDLGTKLKNTTDLLVEIAGIPEIKSTDSGFWIFKEYSHNTTLQSLGEGAIWMGAGLRQFIDAFQGIDIPTDLGQKLSSATDLLVKIAGDKSIQSYENGFDLNGNVFKEFSNNKTLEEMGKGAASIGAGLRSFIDAFYGVQIPPDFSKTIGDVAGVLTEIAGNKAIQSTESGFKIGENNIFTEFSKNNTLQELGEGASGLATGINDFVTTLNGVTIPDGFEEHMNDIISILTDLAGDESVKSFETGFLGVMKNNNTTLDNFSEGAGKVAGAIKKFVEEMSGVTLDTDKMDTALKIINTLSDVEIALSQLGTEDSEYEESKLMEFGNGIDYLADALGSMSSEINDADLGKLAASMFALPLIKSSLETFLSLDTSGAEQLKKDLELLGKLDIGELLDPLTSQAETIKEAASGIKEAFTEGLQSGETGDISSVGTELVGQVASAITDEADQMKTAGETLSRNLSKGFAPEGGSWTIVPVVRSIVERAVKSVNDKIMSFYNAGSYLAHALANGMKSMDGTIANTFVGPVTSASISVSSRYGSFYAAGAHIGEGLAAGMRSALSSIEAAAREMAAKAEAALRYKAMINSPSKVFANLGAGLGEGLVLGMDRMSKDVYSSGESMADSAQKGLKAALSKAADMFEDGLNAEPTIRPVVDMSDIQASSLRIGQMLSMEPGIGLGGIGTLAMAINGRAQSATNDDVIAAIDGLRKSLNITTNTYNVNGITYDDGSNVAAAVGSLIRAARVERRS